MKPTKRMQRRWAQFMPEDVQILADSVTPEKYTYTALGNGKRRCG